MIKRIISAVVFLLCIFSITAFAATQCETDMKASRNAIQSHVYEVSMSTANTKEGIKDYLISEIEKLLVGQTVLYDVGITKFEPAGDGEGSFSFVADLRCGDFRTSSNEKSGTVNTSQVVVMVTSESAEVEVGEKLTLSAEPFDIDRVEYEWYRADSKNGVGVRIEGADGKTYSPNTDEPYSSYFYCVCNGVRSNYVRVSISPKFKPIQSIDVSLDRVREGDSVQINFNIVPSDATNRNVEWSVHSNDGKAKAENGVFKAIEAGTVTLFGTVKNGKGEGEDFTVSLAVIIEKNSEAVNPIYTVVCNVEGIDGLESVSAESYGNTQIYVSELSKKDAVRLTDKSGIYSGGYETLTALSLAGDGVLEYTLKLSGYGDGMILVTEKDGEVKYTEVRTENGELTVPDADKAVILIKKEIEPAVFLIPALAFPALGVCGVAMLKKQSNKNRKLKK